MNWREKYDFNREPVIDGLAYRYEGGKSEPQIWRRPVATPGCNYEIHEAFDISDAGEARCKREWRRLCDRAGDDC
ncbi:MAG: hypothetical protein PHP93_08035 [Kiritimatiellales bacterium]|nr:hypothetical protein [Kiritimatiellales bacterium]